MAIALTRRLGLSGPGPEHGHAPLVSGQDDHCVRAGRTAQIPGAARYRSRERHGRDAGLICVFKTVEPLFGFAIHRNREAKKLELRMEQRKCLYLYHYYQHPVFGFMHIRLQTWLPFQVQIWLNGREWLARPSTATASRISAVTTASRGSPTSSAHRSS